MKYAERLVKLMDKTGVRNKDLVKICGVSNGAISQWKTGTSKPKNLLCIAKALRIEPDSLKAYLEGGNESKLIYLDNMTLNDVSASYPSNAETIPESSIKKVPLIDMVAAGDWCDVADPYPVGEAESWEPCPVPHGENTFAVRINGESMAPKFQHGEIIFCDPSVQANSGDYVIAKLTDENQATFKQLVIEDGKHMLKALNPSWPQRYIPINGNCHIVGKVIARLEKF